MDGIAAASTALATRALRRAVTIQHGTVLTTFPPILQTIVIAQRLSTGRQEELFWRQNHKSHNDNNVIN